MCISNAKRDLRSKLLAKRTAISTTVWENKSAKIITDLKSTQVYKTAKTIHCFVSMNGRNEVNTHAFIKNELTNGKSIIVPITDFYTNTLTHVELLNFDDLAHNKWGVLEPINKVKTQKTPDIILVPLLAADRSFNRLGYGKGFYDRFLEKSSAIKIGLLFEQFLLEKIPVESFDQKLDILITEENIYTRNNLVLEA